MNWFLSNWILGVRRLRKKVGNALKGVQEYTYRKRGSGRNTRKYLWIQNHGLPTNSIRSVQWNLNNFIFYSVYRGDRRGQDIESSNSIPSRHPHHRNYPLPLPPTQAVVTNSLRNRNRYNRKKQPVSNFTTSILIDKHDNWLLPKMLK